MNMAAQYVRMSTDMQRYSIENQSSVIASYAARRGLTIVRKYEDAGKSGLRLEGRPALKRLIADVMSGSADFNVILAYDVSRWGRFQDSDESAHYEFVCREAGVSVEYCAEQFENDGSITTSILKNIKRAMAGEYSRELSVKVHAGQSRLAAMGFHSGAAAGYGLRRVLLDEHGNKKMELDAGQRKHLTTERVVLGPGPAAEIEVVRQVYSLFIDQKKTMLEISAYLNQRGIPNVLGRPWKIMAVRELLTNEKYIGNSLYNRGSKKLGGKWKRNPPCEWVRGSDAFEAIVSHERFGEAQRQIQRNKSRYTDPELLDLLREILSQKQYLSRTVLRESEGAPSDQTYKSRFGSLANAFSKIGYTNEVVAKRHESIALRKSVCAQIATNVSKLGGSVREISNRQCRLLVNEEFTVAVVLGRTSPTNVRRKHNRWRFYYQSEEKADLLIVARFDVGSTSVRDYLVLPLTFRPTNTRLTVSGASYLWFEGYRSKSLNSFYALCARDSLEAHRCG